MTRYNVRRVGSATLVWPATDLTGKPYAELVGDTLADTLAQLGDPTVLAQAVEAGYIEAEPEQHVSNDVPPDAGA